MFHHLEYLDYIIPKAAKTAAMPTRIPVPVISMSGPAAKLDKSTLLLLEGAELVGEPEAEALAGLDELGAPAYELTGIKEVEKGIVVVITVVEFIGQSDIVGAHCVSVTSVVM